MDLESELFLNIKEIIKNEFYNKDPTYLSIFLISMMIIEKYFNEINLMFQELTGEIYDNKYDTAIQFFERILNILVIDNVITLTKANYIYFEFTDNKELIKEFSDHIAYISNHPNKINKDKWIENNTITEISNKCFPCKKSKKSNKSKNNKKKNKYKKKNKTN